MPERPEHSQLDEQTKKAKVEHISHASTGRGAYTKVTLSNGYSEMFAGRLGKREAVSNTLHQWNKRMLGKLARNPKTGDATGDLWRLAMARPTMAPGTRPAHSMTHHDLGNNESASTGISFNPQQEGQPYLALTRSQSKWFATFKGAEKWLAKRGYDAHGKRIG